MKDSCRSTPCLRMKTTEQLRGVGKQEDWDHGGLRQEDRGQGGDDWRRWWQGHRPSHQHGPQQAPSRSAIIKDVFLFLEGGYHDLGQRLHDQASEAQLKDAQDLGQIRQGCMHVNRNPVHQAAKRRRNSTFLSSEVHPSNWHFTDLRDAGSLAH